jgi:hypothetical protein
MHSWRTSAPLTGCLLAVLLLGAAACSASEDTNATAPPSLTPSERVAQQVGSATSCAEEMEAIIAGFQSGAIGSSTAVQLATSVGASGNQRSTLVATMMRLLGDPNATAAQQAVFVCRSS